MIIAMMIMVMMIIMILAPDISMEFAIWPNVAMLWLKIVSTDHDEVLH